MASSEQVKKTVAGMDDYELIERWKSNSFSDDARPLAEAELIARGISTASPMPRTVPDDGAPTETIRRFPAIESFFGPRKGKTTVRLYAAGSALAMASAFVKLWGFFGIILAVVLFWAPGHYMGAWLSTMLRGKPGYVSIPALGVILIFWTFSWLVIAGLVHSALAR